MGGMTGMTRWGELTSSSSSSSTFGVMGMGLRRMGGMVGSRVGTMGGRVGIRMASSEGGGEAAGKTVEAHASGVRKWLFGSAGLVYGMIVLGGVTRLTESGLSMTTWSVTGSLPPMSEEAWEAEFALYKDSPEYEQLNRGMSVGEFKQIFWYEYSHRMLGRVIGLVYAGGAAWAWKTGALRALGLGPRVLAIGALLGGQGALGWYMVKSGLRGGYDENSKAPPRVSQYRLAAHLSSALAIYSTMLWTALELVPVAAKTASAAPGLRLVKIGAHALSGILGVTIVSGAFVAGMDAGLVYNEFPYMGNSIVPSDYWVHPTFWKNALENESAAQFHHRVLGLTTATGALGVAGYVLSRGRALSSQIRTSASTLVGLVTLQVSLGISALLYEVPVWLGAGHQAGSVALLSALLWIMRIAK